jgi:hypothetical protein
MEARIVAGWIERPEPVEVVVEDKRSEAERVFGEA